MISHHTIKIFKSMWWCVSVVNKILSSWRFYFELKYPAIRFQRLFPVFVFDILKRSEKLKIMSQIYNHRNSFQKTFQPTLRLLQLQFQVKVWFSRLVETRWELNIRSVFSSFPWNGKIACQESQFWLCFSKLVCLLKKVMVLRDEQVQNLNAE